MSKGLRRYEFSERLADILGTARRDLRYRVTLLVAEGLLPAGARGPGSPPATPAYAADLLIGVMAAPTQAHTVEAIRSYGALVSAANEADSFEPGVVVGGSGRQPAAGTFPSPEPETFHEALARLLERARDGQLRQALLRELFGLWISRGFPVASIQVAAWNAGRGSIRTRRYGLRPGARPPAWLDPERGGVADPGLLHTVFLPAAKLVEIGRLTAPAHERKPAMLDLGPAISKISDIARLARERRHRRPWRTFLETAASVQEATESADARAGRLAEVIGFGANPGNLRMLTYVPADLPSAPALVVVMHGCTQTAASYDAGTGWSTLADRHGFALLYPEQKRANNPLRCFNWFRGEDHRRDSGEAQSIREMVERMIIEHGIDRGRVYITGLSAGGAMTSVMLATYPDVFAGGAIVAAVPYGCAQGLQEAFDVIFQGKSLSSEEWGEKVRAASPHRGPWPTVSVWHGAADTTVKPINAEEIIKQWANIHELAARPTVETMIDGHQLRIWQGVDGRDLVSSYTIDGMAHGQPVDPVGDNGSGRSAPFFHAVGIASPYHIARGWGLTETRRDVASTVRPTTAPPPAAAPAHLPQEEPAPSAGAPEAPPEAEIVPPAVTPRPEVIAPAGGRAIEIPAAAPRHPRQEERPAAAAGVAGVDIGGILKTAFDAAGLSRDGRDAGAGGSPGIAGIDVVGIIAKSLEAAGVLAGGRGGRSSTAADNGSSRGIDIQGILAKSFEAAGLVPGGERAADAGGSPGEDLAGTGWRGDGWKRLADAPARSGDPEPPLFGYASSGVRCDVGEKVCAVSRRVALGDRPKLRYERKLDLNAAINILTTATFVVRIDGEPVDEVAAVGMDYSESAWTERSDIDLGRFAGRTVTLAFELTANSNICLEVYAKSWLSGIVVEDGTWV